MPGAQTEEEVRVADKEMQNDFASEVYRNVRDSANIARTVSGLAEQFGESNAADWRKIAETLASLEGDIKKLLKE